jgi:large subunit ribosomal protein L25
MSEVMLIEVERREKVGKGGGRKARRSGKIPAILYGEGKDPVPIQVDRRRLVDLFQKGGYENRIFLLRLAGTDQTRHALVRDLQLDPITDQIMHIDFQRVSLEQRIRVRVHVRLEGVPIGVKNEGGLLDFVTRELEVECRPDRIPSEIVVPVSALHVGQHLEVESVAFPEGVTYVGSPGVVVASVTHPRGIEAPGPEAAAESPAEPEVLSKGKSAESAS